MTPAGNGGPTDARRGGGRDRVRVPGPVGGPEAASVNRWRPGSSVHRGLCGPTRRKELLSPVWPPGKEVERRPESPRTRSADALVDDAAGRGNRGDPPTDAEDDVPRGLHVDAHGRARSSGARAGRVGVRRLPRLGFDGVPDVPVRAEHRPADVLCPRSGGQREHLSRGEHQQDPAPARTWPCTRGPANGRDHVSAPSPPTPEADFSRARSTHRASATTGLFRCRRRGPARAPWDVRERS